MTALDFFTPGLPAPKGSLRMIAKGVVKEDNPRTRPWRAAVALNARQAINRKGRGIALTGPVKVSVALFLPRPKSNRDRWPIKRSSGDLDKHLRTVLDGLADEVTGAHITITPVEVER